MARDPVARATELRQLLEIHAIAQRTLRLMERGLLNGKINADQFQHMFRLMMGGWREFVREAYPDVAFSCDERRVNQMRCELQRLESRNPQRTEEGESLFS